MNVNEKVLIVDSNQEHCKQIKDALRGYCVGAYYTLSVVEAIERLMRQHYELVILDISLSETEGLQLLRFMRQMPIDILPWKDLFRYFVNRPNKLRKLNRG